MLETLETRWNYKEKTSENPKGGQRKKFRNAQ